MKKLDHRKYKLNYCYKKGCRCFHCVANHRQYYLAKRKVCLARAKVYAKNNIHKITKYKKAWYERNKLRIRDDWYKRTYGIDSEGYMKLHDKQGGKCGICRKVASTTLSVDHDHKTGKIRGLLCRGCNFAIGLMKDDVGILRRAIGYLAKERSH